MKNQEEIKTAIYQYIADSIDCSIEQLESDDTFFVNNRKEEKDYIKILSIKDANIISCSEDKYEIGKQLLAGKIRDELYESTLIFGQMLMKLKLEGYKQASLAVQKMNYAVRMYRKVGFEIVDENDEEYIMICKL